MDTFEMKELSNSLLGFIDTREKNIENALRAKDRNKILLNVEPMMLYNDIKNGMEKVKKIYSYCLRELTKIQLDMVLGLLKNSCIDLKEKFVSINKSSLNIYGTSAIKGASCVLDELYGKSFFDKAEGINNQIDCIKNGSYDNHSLMNDKIKMLIGLFKAGPLGAKNVEDYNKLVDDYFKCRFDTKKYTADAISVLCAIIEDDYDFYKKNRYIDQHRVSVYDDRRAVLYYTKNINQKNVDIFLIEKERNKGPCIIW